MVLRCIIFSSKVTLSRQRIIDLRLPCLCRISRLIASAFSGLRSFSNLALVFIHSAFPRMKILPPIPFSPLSAGNKLIPFAQRLSDTLRNIVACPRWWMDCALRWRKGRRTRLKLMVNSKPPQGCDWVWPRQITGGPGWFAACSCKHE